MESTKIEKVFQIGTLEIGSTFVPDFVNFVHWQASFYQSFKSVVEKFNVFRIIVSLGKWTGESPKTTKATTL